MSKGQQKQVPGCPPSAPGQAWPTWLWLGTGEVARGWACSSYVNALAKAQSFSLPDFLTSIIAPGHSRLPSCFGWTQYWLHPGEEAVHKGPPLK